MNIAKNMEAIIVVVIALIGVTSYATATAASLHAAPRVSAQDSTTMQVVTISAKRLSAAEKAQLAD